MKRNCIKCGGWDGVVPPFVLSSPLNLEISLVLLIFSGAFNYQKDHLLLRDRSLLQKWSSNCLYLKHLALKSFHVPVFSNVMNGLCILQTAVIYTSTICLLAFFHFKCKKALTLNIDLPDMTKQNFYRQCLLVGMEGSTCKFPPLMTQVWNNHFFEFPNPTFKSYSTYAVNYVATKLKTNMLNSLWVPFFKRQGYVINCFLKKT